MLCNDETLSHSCSWQLGQGLPQKDTAAAAGVERCPLCGMALPQVAHQHRQTESTAEIAEVFPSAWYYSTSCDA